MCFAGNNRNGLFLVPMFGGIWTLCIHLSEAEFQHLRDKENFPAVPQCVNYLEESARNSNDEMKTGWQHSESQMKEYQPSHLSRYNGVRAPKAIC